MPDAPLIDIPGNPIPPGFSTRYLEAFDGGRIRIGMVRTSMPRRGAVLVVPGWAEFIEKYLEVAHDLLARGFDVMICDPRGQGYSQRVARGDDRGLVKDFSVFQKDMAVVTAAFRAAFDGPYFLLGHSMGGLISLTYMIGDGRRGMDGAVLCAPLTRLFARKVTRYAAQGVLAVAIAAGQRRRQLTALPQHSMTFETNNLTQDERRHDVFRRLQLEAPEAQAGQPRIAWVNAAMRATAAISKPDALAPLPMQVLLISATRDATVDASHHIELAQTYPQILLRRVEGARHEIMMEKDVYRDKFWEYFDDYVEARLSASTKAPSATSSTSPSSTKSSSAAVTAGTE